MLGLLRHGRACYVSRTGFSRFLSTGGSTQHTTPPTSASPPPLNPRSRKHKLDIRPIKLEIPQSSPNAPTPSLPRSEKTGSVNPAAILHENSPPATVHGVLAPPPPGASWLQKLLHQGKQLFKFYWNGLKLIYANRKQVKEVERRVRTQGIPMTRSETIFARTNKQDLVKLIPFVLILLIAEEALPLFVLYAPILLPSTCLLVSQRNRIISKRATKYQSLVGSSEDVLQRIAVSQESNFKLLCGVLSLSTFGPGPLLKRRLASHMQFIDGDDMLLLKEAGGVGCQVPHNLSHDEILQVLSDRGFATTDVDLAYARRCLEWYYAQPSRSGDLDERFALVAKAALHSQSLQNVN